ncbi:MAG: N-Acetyl-D-glucosamine ABC transport system, permease protein 2 [uncultured Thermomicrobiales bacterium]|uniref:N-Acetyl-D-glucosamine ABC transport system, permease protein 2 n=1 Tax=uncultured Thermomicrobiales bacterium TaxID=1645740 RepID=A0A6J4VD52_9BACT|nr:MAG: N-Acetyl-D-glucosamine ABC transport system, permease protein 2 [uncultured Thermomicrobiales bacterium]
MATLLPSRPGRRQRDLWPWLLVATLAVASLVFVLPLLLMLAAAFKPSAEILQSPPTLLPQSPTLDNFRTVLAEAPYGAWYRNSLVVAGAVTFLAMATSALGGYIFAKFEFPLKKPLFALVLATLMIPFPVLLIPNYLVANRLGLLNSLWALILPGVVSAFGIFLVRQFVAGIPSDLIEAARLDGASEWAIFLRIVVPLVRPALAALGVFTFLASWNDYLWPLVAINDLEKSTLPLALTFFNSVNATRYDLVMAAATMAVVPVLVVFLIFQRQIVKALVLAGMK